VVEVVRIHLNFQVGVVEVAPIHLNFQVEVVVKDLIQARPVAMAHLALSNLQEQSCPFVSLIYPF
jgi:hypothetical protein